MTSAIYSGELTCPSCGNKFTARLYAMVDADDPGAEEMVLNGMVNVVQCPHCGNWGRMALPFAYHDADKELFLVYMPANAPLPQKMRDSFIGDVTRTLMETLPSDKRKGYLLRPKELFTLDGMKREILRAEGLTDEEIDRYIRGQKLLEELLDAAGNTARIEELVRENADVVDKEFVIELRKAVYKATKDAGEEEKAKFDGLVQWILENTEAGRRVEDFSQKMKKATRAATYEAVFDILSGVSDDFWEYAVDIAKPILDETFFDRLAKTILEAEKSDPEKAERLRKMRNVFMERYQEMQSRAREAYTEASRLLDRLIEAEDVEEKVEEMLPEILLHPEILASIDVALATAEQVGNEEMLEKLQDIRNIILSETIGSSPEEALLYGLLDAEYPEGVQQLLQDNREAITPEFFEMLDYLITVSGSEEQKKLLRNLKAMASLMS